MKNETHPNMPLTNVLLSWMQEVEWQDEVSIDHEKRESSMSTGYEIDGQRFKLVIECDEKRGFLSVFMYTKFSVPTDSHQEMCLHINDVNHQLMLGRFSFSTNRPIQYRACCDLEDQDVNTKIINNMVCSASAAFSAHLKSFGCIVFANFTSEQLRKEAQERNEQSQSSGQEEITEL